MTGKQLRAVYVLRLEGGRYYVGETGDPTSRLWAHFEGRGASWTQQHSPVAVEKFTMVEGKEQAKSLEHLLTVEYATKIGPPNVRGAGWTAQHDPPTAKTEVG